jgi:hypothetical protein
MRSGHSPRSLHRTGCQRHGSGQVTVGDRHPAWYGVLSWLDPGSSATGGPMRSSSSRRLRSGQGLTARGPRTAGRLVGCAQHLVGRPRTATNNPRRYARYGNDHPRR